LDVSAGTNRGKNNAATGKQDHDRQPRVSLLYRSWRNPVDSERQDGGEYGICIFGEDGSVKNGHDERRVSGRRHQGYRYVTPAARYCVITGGTYRITGQGNAEMEQVSVFRQREINVTHGITIMGSVL